MSALENQYLTPEEYLTRERAADHKSEYLSGQIFMMSGASFGHIGLSGNIYAELFFLLRGKPCRPLNSDMRVLVEGTSLYTYPDVTVLCGPPIFADSHLDILTNPAVIFEVLSPTTESYDRGLKFAHYRRLGSLMDYVLVSQDRVSVEHYARQTSGQWLMTSYENMSETLLLTTLDCSLPLSLIYADVIPTPGLEAD